MVSTGRRSFLVATSAGVSALAGCLARSNGSSDGSLADDLNESIATGIDAIPTSADGASIAACYVINEPVTSENDIGQFLTGDPSTIGLERSQLDCVVIGLYGRSLKTIRAYVGTFDASDVDAPDGAGVSASDGLALRATGTSVGWSAGLDAATNAKGDPETGIDGDYSMGSLFAPMTDAQIIVGLLYAGDDEQLFPDDVDVSTDAIRAVAVGMRPDVEAREQTTTYVVLFEEDASPDAAAIDALVRTDDYDGVSPGDVDVTTDDRRAITTFTHDLPKDRLPDNSPSARFMVRYDADSGVATITNHGSEAVEAVNLELRVDGERIDAPWPADGTIESGARYEFEAAPLSFVRVVWNDPNLDGIAHTLGQELLDARTLFERSYDPDADELTMTYTRDRAPDLDGFLIDHSEPGPSLDTDTPLSEYVDALQQGTEVVLSDVQYGDSVDLHYTPDANSSLEPLYLFTFRAEPPGAFELVEEAGTQELVFRGAPTVQSSNLRVLLDGDRTDRQWSDVAETLSGGERLALDVGLGSTVRVEYVESDTAVGVFSETVLPDVTFSYDVNGSSIEVTHDGGEAVSADDLAVQFAAPESIRADAFTSEYETVEAGDSITVEYPDGDGEGPSVLVVLYRGHSLSTEFLDPESFGTEDSDRTGRS